MRTWSVSGTALALCTRSSSLSIRTSTSMGSSLLLRAERGAAPAVREELLEALRDRVRDQFVNLSAKGGDLLHTARGNKGDLRARHHEDRLDVRSEVPVQLVHLELPLEVGRDAQALDDRLRLPAAGEVDDELLEDVDLDVLRCDGLLDERDAILGREHRRFVV